MQPRFNMPPTASANGCNASSVYTTPSTNSPEPPTKRRKMNDTASSSVSDIYSEMDSINEDDQNSMEPVSLEPLPLPIPGNVPPAVPRMMPMMQPPMMPPSMGSIHPPQMLQQPYPMMPSMAPPGMPSNAMFQSSAPPTTALLPEIGKLECTETGNEDKRDSTEEGDYKSLEMDEHYSGYLEDMPPEILVSDNDLCPLSLLDDAQDIAVIDETVDECGSVIGSQPDIKVNQMVYL